jgi:hypothetical protein
MHDVKDAAVPTEGWLRGPAYRKKYGIGPTTYWLLKKQKRIEVHDGGGGLEYVRDRLPSPTPLES